MRSKDLARAKCISKNVSELQENKNRSIPSTIDSRMSCNRSLDDKTYNPLCTNGVTAEVFYQGLKHGKRHNYNYIYSSAFDDYLNIDRNKAFIQHHKQIKSRQHELAFSSNQAGVFEARNPTVSITVPVGRKSKQLPEQATHSNNNSSKSNEVALLKPSAPLSERDLFNQGYSNCVGVEMNTYSVNK